ncbi:MAG: ATP-binding protein [Candidatus Aminicenantales bacterium]
MILLEFYGGWFLVHALTITAELSEIEKARRFLHESLAGLDISEEDSYKIELSLVEMCTNIITYGYPKEKGRIDLRTWHQGEKVYVEIQDSGIPFDPRKAKTPDLGKNLCTGKKGGLGIFLSRQMMDGFDYKRENGKNILTMYKKIKRN